MEKIFSDTPAMSTKIKADMKMRLILPIAALFFLFLLSGCAKDLPKPDVPLSNVPVTDYVLVRGDSSGSAVLRQVVNLKKQITDKFGKCPSSATDWAIDVEQNPQTHREILIGITNREESVAANNQLKGKYGYIIRGNEDCIVITASSERLLERAVERFVSEFLDASKDGFLPSYFDIMNTDDGTVLYLDETNSQTPTLVLPSNAPPLLSYAAESFAQLTKEFCGMDIPIVKGSSENAVVFGFYDEKGSEKGADDRTFSSDVWQVRCVNDCVVMEGDSELLLMSALSALYECLTESPDRTLSGQALLCYNKMLILRDSWQQKVPRITGGVYLGTESVASNSSRSLYESVTQTAMEKYRYMLTEMLNYESMGTTITGSTTYRNETNKKELILMYNFKTGDLNIVETFYS